MNDPIAVTGAAGNVGGRVVEVLASAGAEVVGLTRRPSDPPAGASSAIAGYDDPPALRRALTGVRTLVMVTSDGETTAMLRHHANLLDAAAGCAVEHVVLLSSLDADAESPFCYARTAAATEARLAASVPGWSIARASIFSEFFIAEWVVPAGESGQIRLPAEHAAISFVSRLDVAESLAALATLAPTNHHHDVTGPAALTLPAVADLATVRHGRPVRHVDISPQQHRLELAEANTDPWWSYAYATMYSSIRQQRWTATSTAVDELTGHAARSFGEVLGDALR